MEVTFQHSLKKDLKRIIVFLKFESLDVKNTDLPRCDSMHPTMNLLVRAFMCRRPHEFVLTIESFLGLGIVQRIVTTAKLS